MSDADDLGQRAIVMQTEDQEPVGFMLTHLEPAIDDGEYEGECVFMLLPKRADLLDSEVAIIISELKVRGEHACRMRITTNQTVYQVTPQDLPPLSLVLESEGRGSMSVVEGAEMRKVGIVEFANK